MRSIQLVLLPVAEASLLLSPCQSLRFDLKSGYTKCISEEIKSNSMSVSKYSVLNPHDSQPMPESHMITVRVTSLCGNNYHYSDHVELGQFAFTATEQGDYITCFWAVDHRLEATVTINFDWKPASLLRTGLMLQRRAVSISWNWSRRSWKTITSIHDEMFYLGEREDQMQEHNRSTNSRMAWMSLHSLVVCLSVTTLQLWHVKTFFEKKKII